MRRTEQVGKLRNQIRIESILLISVLAISAALVSTAPCQFTPPSRDHLQPSVRFCRWEHWLDRLG